MNDDLQWAAIIALFVVVFFLRYDIDIKWKWTEKQKGWKDDK